MDASSLKDEIGTFQKHGGRSRLLILWNRAFVDVRLAFIQPQMDFIRSEEGK